MQSKITVVFLLAACVASCLGTCHLEVGGTAESYLCENIQDLTSLSTIPDIAQRITILNSVIQSIPKETFIRFSSSLVYLNITNSKLNDIHPGAFLGLNQLRDLILNHNGIRSINTHWIQDLKSLRTLRVWNNHISEIEPEVFNHLPNLVLLDIAYNNIDYCIPPESLAKLQKLESFYLTENPWPLRCRPPVIFHLEHNHVQAVHTWGNSHILIEECLAHEPRAQWNNEVLEKCVTKHGVNITAL